MKFTYLPLGTRGFKAAFPREASSTDTSHGNAAVFYKDYQPFTKMNSYYIFTILEEPMYYY